MLVALTINGNKSFLSLTGLIELKFLSYFILKGRHKLFNLLINKFMSLENPFNQPSVPSQEIPESEQESKQEKMEPKEVLRYMAKLGKDITEEAKIAEVMIEEAKERGIKINIDEKIREFEPLKEIEIQLVNIRLKLGELMTDMLHQGVKMTHEDVKTRMKKMEGKKEEKEVEKK